MQKKKISGLRELGKPRTDEDFAKLKEAATFNEKEKGYWDGLVKRGNTQFEKQGYTAEKIKFFKQELRKISGKFGKRIAVERLLKYKIGYAYEWLGTHGKGYDAAARAGFFENAVLWYHAADEAVGFLTDYALRQSEACAGAARYGRESGLDDKIIKWLFQRGMGLISTLFPNAVIIGAKMPEQLKKQADTTIDGTVKAYLFRKHRPEDN